MFVGDFLLQSRLNSKREIFLLLYFHNPIFLQFFDKKKNRIFVREKVFFLSFFDIRKEERNE